MTHGLVKYKKFATEEEQIEWQQNNPYWYPVHSDKGIFSAYSKVAELCVQAVEMTNKAYKLKVGLAVDPQYGSNWATCH